MQHHADLPIRDDLETPVTDLDVLVCPVAGVTEDAVGSEQPTCLFSMTRLAYHLVGFLRSASKRNKK